MPLKTEVVYSIQTKLGKNSIFTILKIMSSCCCHSCWSRCAWCCYCNCQFKCHCWSHFQSCHSHCHVVDFVIVTALFMSCHVMSLSKSVVIFVSCYCHFCVFLIFDVSETVVVVVKGGNSGSFFFLIDTRCKNDFHLLRHYWYAKHHFTAVTFWRFWLRNNRLNLPLFTSKIPPFQAST